MSNTPIATKKRTSYENFVADCPWCGEENTFNRASDLHTFKPIAGLDVSCLNTECGRTFRIVGDSVNNPHEMLVFDCYELIAQKHYMNCVLTLAQAYEVFFNLYFRVELIYRPFGADLNRDKTQLDRISEKLSDKLAKHPFARMRSLFLQYIVIGNSPSNLVEAEAEIDNLPKQPKDPKDTDIERINDIALVTLLKTLKATKINTLRNSIVHKQAYRPTLQEVETLLKETRSILFPLTSHFELYDEINWYMRKS